MTRLMLTTFCTLFSTWQYIVLSLAECANCARRMQDIVDGSMSAPFVYRQLTPQIIVALGDTPLALVGYQAVVFALFYGLLWTWARRWGVLPLVMLPLFAMVIAIMMPTYYASLYTSLEWTLWLFALLVLPRWSLSRR